MRGREVRGCRCMKASSHKRKKKKMQLAQVESERREGEEKDLKAGLLQVVRFEGE